MCHNMSAAGRVRRRRNGSQLVIAKIDYEVRVKIEREREKRRKKG